MNKKILFISGLDFKQRSIQVILKTPEAYREKGWDVTYILARDNCEIGNYFYEREINPHDIKIIRTYWPLNKIRKNKNNTINVIFNKISGIFTIFKLARLAHVEMKKTEFDILYGYELHGVLALKLAKLFNNTNGKKTVSRFQGTFLNEMLQNRQYLRLLFNLDHILALRAKTDLLIMTDDGTQGNKALSILCPRSMSKMKFWINGVDILTPDSSKVEEIKKRYNIGDKFTFISVSRLVDWKRIDRCLLIMNELKKIGCDQFKYLIVGDGNLKSFLQEYANNLGLYENLIFIGSVRHDEVKNYISASDILLSMYDSTNVGNPLLESIRLMKPIVTLNNGDTGSWITHQHNGLIYPAHKFDPTLIASDLYNLINSPEEYSVLVKMISKTSNEKLWTWHQRMSSEINEVTKLLSKYSRDC